MEAANLAFDLRDWSVCCVAFMADIARALQPFLDPGGGIAVAEENQTVSV
jgi:hypothetical protein